VAPQDNATLKSVRVVALVVGTLRDVDPAIAAKIPADLEVNLVQLRDRLSALRVWEVADRLRAIAGGVALVGALLLLAAIVVAPDRRRATTLVGHGLIVAGGFVVVLVAVVRSVVLGGGLAPDVQAAVDAVFRAFVGPLVTAALWTIVIGLLIATASLATRRDGPRITPTSVSTAARRAFAYEPASTAGRFARGVLVTLFGLALIRFRDGVMPLIIGTAGVLVAYAGLVFVFQVIGRDPLPAAQVDRERQERRRRIAQGVAVVAIVGCLLAAVVAIRTAGNAPRAAATAGMCNGHAALCDRRVDQVAFAASHNSMSNAADGFINALQTDGLQGQLASGIRGLLIDLYEATPWKGTVYTDLNQQKTAEITDQVGPELAARAQELRDIAGPPPGSATPALYLCHGFCELGATPAIAQMQIVRDFLAANPDEVVMMIIQDYVDGARTAGLFRDAGLDRYAYRGSGAPWPTLGDLVSSDRRLLVFSENFGGSPKWLRPFPTNFQETPYGFADLAEIESPASCDPGRGLQDRGLFLLNHWLTPGTATEAKVVNSTEVLGGRAQRCETIRKHLPNVVAVDFASFGDLIGVVDTLNGFPPTPPTTSRAATP